ncbi:MAG: ParB/RepB/Spo0J family partition protein [Candidatus Omnitrophica bacterium]|nr:ParB/RepB/Spo0J family partition protein [Candidatus Omnitrophota bacterium]
MQKRALGKGLAALIPKKPKEEIAAREFVHLSLNKIRIGKYQPRQEMNPVELSELTRSIREKGIIQPVLVRKTGEDEYELVAGGRRYQAAKLLELKDIPAIVKELDDKDTFILAIVENLQRTDLNAIDEAQALKRLMDEFAFSLEDVAKVVGKDKTTIANTLRLLKLPLEIRKALRKGIINRSQARTILSVSGETKQISLFHDILKGGLSVREIEKRTKPKKKKDDPFVRELEEKLQQALGTKVTITNKRTNKGKMIIEYYSLNDLERITRRIT